MADPLIVAVGIAGFLAAACWVLSLIFREYSWVDRLWSVAPAIYAWWFAYAGGFSPRVTLATVVVTAWAARLTYNFARKGGYAKGGEDYRWEVMRAKMGPGTWQVFNVLFICGFQHALILGFTLPVWMMTATATGPLTSVDVVGAGAMLFFLVGETIADQQQWNFQQAKKAKRERGEPVREQFVTTGLFRYSRHPNFFCEMSFWWSLYAWSVAAGAPLWNWTIAGPIVLTFVFLGSTPLTEGISASKYPEYAGYQKRVSRLIPWLPKRG